MPDKKMDRPWVKLARTKDGLNLAWGPNQGPWGIFNEAHIRSPQTVKITEWWLSVGTKANVKQNDANKDEPSNWELFNASVGTKNKLTIPWYGPRPPKRKVLARVIGKFHSKGTNNERFEEGIYSDVERLKIKPLK